MVETFRAATESQKRGFVNQNRRVKKRGWALGITIVLGGRGDSMRRDPARGRRQRRERAGPRRDLDPGNRNDAGPIEISR